MVHLVFYNSESQRTYSHYIGQAPEHGKATFQRRYDAEIKNIKRSFPNAIYVGLADGAVDNWIFFGDKVDQCILDFWHAVEYLATHPKQTSTVPHYK